MVNKAWLFFHTPYYAALIADLDLKLTPHIYSFSIYWKWRKQCTFYIEIRQFEHKKTPTFIVRVYCTKGGT